MEKKTCKDCTFYVKGSEYSGQCRHLYPLSHSVGRECGACEKFLDKVCGGCGAIIDNQPLKPITDDGDWFCPVCDHELGGLENE